MELVNRYVQAVRFWLPKTQSDDIAAELGEDIRSQIEEKEAAMGHEMNEDEIAELLKQHGRPMLVANRFHQQQYLIGPVLFPIYRLVLKLVAIFLMVPWVLAWIGVAVSRAAHSGESILNIMGSFWTSFWPMAFFVLGSVTAVFAVLERMEAKSHSLERWDPRKLPPVRDPHRIPLANSITEITANLVFCTWVIGGAWYETKLRFAGVSITLTPAWRYFFWGFVLLAVANLAVSSANLFRPYWSPVRAGFRLLSDCAGGAMFCLLLQSNIVGSIDVVNVAASKTAQVVQAINWWSAKMVPVAIIACVVIVTADCYRIFRIRTKTSRRIVFNAASGTL